MTSSLLGDAVAHHLWASDRLIEECAALTPEQLATPIPGTYGSIIGTLRHLVASDRWYLSFFREGTEPIDEDADVGLDELRSAMAASGVAWMELLAGAVDPDLDIVEVDGGLEVHSPASLRLAQVVHHGTDHRSQVCTALTALGRTPPEIDVWAYARATGRERGVETGAQ
jgi:uncharacterized damage-inducible protein DinB